MEDDMDDKWIGSTNPNHNSGSDEMISSLQRRINECGFVIIAAPQVLAIGYVLKGVSNMMGSDKVIQPFVVTREVTHADWVEQNRRFDSSDPFLKPLGWDFFYEVRTD